MENNSQLSPQDKEKLVNSIVKAFAYAENGGEPNIKNPSAGKSGELKSVFQFEPSTWETDSKRVFGKVEPIDPDKETYVMQQKVGKWIDEGKTVSEMASEHNSGNPNAYKENHVGTNKYGVKYDTPAYAKKVLDYSREFYSGTGQKPQVTPLSAPKQDLSNSAPVKTLLNIISQAKTAQTPTGPVEST